MNSAAFKRGLHDGVPIGLGYFAVSFTFGMMAAAGGISAGAAVLISLTNLTSAGQFAGIEIIFASGSLWEMALTQLVINLRYCLMSFSLSQKLERGTSTGHRLLVAFGVTDEFLVSVQVRMDVSVPGIIMVSWQWQFRDGRWELWSGQYPGTFCRTFWSVL